MPAQSSWARAGKMQLSLPPTPGPRSLSQWQEGASIWPPFPPLSALLLTVLEPLLLPFPQKLFPVGPEDSFLDRKGAGWPLSAGGEPGQRDGGPGVCP